MSRYGNTSVSALLSAARSALKKQQAYEEEIASYEYDLSEKSQEDYQKYVDFLSKRVSQIKDQDPSKALSLQRKITGAQRSFTSSEIQRQSIGILEGTGSKQGKLQALIGLYRNALANGDEALAQRLQYQADQLQVQIMNEASGGSGGYGRGSGGSGSSTADATAAKKGIDAQLDKIKYAQTDLDKDLARGKISSQDYIAKTAQLLDGKNKILSSTYTVDGEGYIRPNQYSALSNDDLYSFYQKHAELQDSKIYKQFIGTNPNVPLDVQLARIAGAYKTKLNPVTKEYELVPGDVVGLRRMTELGSTLSAPNTDLNVDNEKYKNAFKSIGINDGVSSGSLKRTIKPVGSDTPVESQFYLDNPDNPKYAFTEGKFGERYALDPNTGQVALLQDSKAANDQLGVLQDRLTNQNISPQEREAIVNDIKNLNTDLVPQDILDANKKAGLKNEVREGLGPFGFSADFGVETVKPFIDKFSLTNNNATKLIEEVKKKKLLEQAMASARELGAEIGPLKSGVFGVLPALQQRVNQLSQLVQQKRQREIEEANRRAEQARQAASSASKAALARISPNARPNYTQGTVNNAPGPYRIPQATQKAADTVGTPEFTQKYAFPGIDLSKYLRF